MNGMLLGCRFIWVWVSFPFQCKRFGMHSDVPRALSICVSFWLLLKDQDNLFYIGILSMVESIQFQIDSLYWIFSPSASVNKNAVGPLCQSVVAFACRILVMLRHFNVGRYWRSVRQSGSQTIHWTAYWIFWG